MHNPIGFLSMRGSTSVEDECFPHPNHTRDIEPDIGCRVNGLVTSGRLPEAGHSSPIRASSRRILLVLVAKKIPLGRLYRLRVHINVAFLYTKKTHIYLKVMLSSLILPMSNV